MLVANTRLGRKVLAPYRVLRYRPRLVVSAVIGIAVIFLLPAQWAVPVRLLVGWDVGVGLYLVLAYSMMASCDLDYIRRRAAQQDEGRVTMLALTVSAAVASLGAIVGELGQGGS